MCIYNHLAITNQLSSQFSSSFALLSFLSILLSHHKCCYFLGFLYKLPNFTQLWLVVINSLIKSNLGSVFSHTELE